MSNMIIPVIEWAEDSFVNNLKQFEAGTKLTVSYGGEEVSGIVEAYTRSTSDNLNRFYLKTDTGLMAFMMKENHFYYAQSAGLSGGLKVIKVNGEDPKKPSNITALNLFYVAGFEAHEIALVLQYGGFPFQASIFKFDHVIKFILANDIVAIQLLEDEDNFMCFNCFGLGEVKSLKISLDEARGAFNA